MDDAPLVAVGSDSTARLRAAGLVPDPYVQQRMDRAALDAVAGALAKPRLTISEKIVQIAESLPDEAIEGIPTDGASNLDHYLYGAPKRDTAHCLAREPEREAAQVAAGTAGTVTCPACGHTFGTLWRSRYPDRSRSIAAQEGRTAQIWEQHTGPSNAKS